MYSLLSKRDRRQLDFLEVLMEENSLTLNKISEKTGYSIRTLSADIVQINSYLTPIKIETSLAGISLNIPTNSSIREIYTLILKQSRECQLLLYLLNNEDKIQDEIAEDLYISVSTLKRLLKPLNEKLKVRDVFINNGPIFVSGNEKNILQIYVALFSEAYHNGGDIIGENERNLLSELCKRMSQEGYFALNYPDLIRLQLLVYIRLTRIKNGHHVNMTENDIFEGSFDILKDKIFCSKFENLFKVKLNKNILIELFNLYLKPDYAKNIAELNEITKKSSGYKDLDNKIKRLLRLISKSLDISIDDTENLRLDLFNISKFMDKPVNILYSKNKIFKNEFFRVNNRIARKINKSIDKVFSNSVDEDSKEEILYLLATHWPSLLEKIKETTPKITIGIFFDSDVEHAQMIVDLIKEYSKVKIKVLYTAMRDEGDINSMCKDVDLLVTNIPELKVSCKEVVCVQEYPTSRDMKNIILAEEHIYHNKLYIDNNES